MKISKDIACILANKVLQNVNENRNSLKKEIKNDKNVLKRANNLINICKKNKELITFLGYQHLLDSNTTVEFFVEKIANQELNKVKKSSIVTVADIQYLALECKDIEELKQKLNLTK